MPPTDRPAARSGLARFGFAELAAAGAGLDELHELTGIGEDVLLDGVEGVADPDAALASLVRILRREPACASVLQDANGRRRAWLVLGASDGLAAFFVRHPEEFTRLAVIDAALPTAAETGQELLDAVGAVDGFAARGDDDAWNALRIVYRRLLVRIALADLSHDDPVEVLPDVAAALADAAAAALDASLAVARTRLADGVGIGPRFTREEVAATRLAIIGMGKAGAHELNYVSDVDVIFVAEPASDAEITEGRAIEVGTQLAMLTMRGISSPEIEPPLWEVDANLRPEGKQGSLVRTLESHLSYYDRWAKSWEFQALLKARAMAGDRMLGAAYIEGVAPKVWTSATREDFVESVQRMRERVTEHIPAGEAPYQLKLGPGGLRDIEFTTQLLQLVHGVSDPSIRQASTLDALDALVEQGYIGRTDAAAFSRDYRALRVLEHRLQLRGLRRTHLMPSAPDDLRVLGRAAGIAGGPDAVRAHWEGIKREVRDIHVRLFYRPLLSAVAALPEDGRTLSAAQAEDRLAAIGFVDPKGALRHIAALTSGLSRKATIQRHLMPVMLRWFADGVDPDDGLLVFRRISERLGDTPWFLRMLRDSSGAAESLTRVLSGSRYIGNLMEGFPESVVWLDAPDRLRPRTADALREEARAIQSRHDSMKDAMAAVRALRRRELLRTAMGAVLGILSIDEIAAALTGITEATIQATLRAVERDVVPDEAADLDFAVIAMGRFGGAELGFGSDADILYVYRPSGVDPDLAHRVATKIVAGLREHSEDPRAPLELDADLRPEGRNGPLVRSLDAYAEYYARWSLSWESQALLRARGVAGSRKLIAGFMDVADRTRYPASPDEAGLREIRRIKARVENERLPRGTDPSRHLKLGPGGLSDVEWLVQLLQLEHGHRIAGLRTTSTLGALEAAVEAGLIDAEPAGLLRDAWTLASRLRSANTLLSGQTSDALPTDRRRLDGIGRLLEYPDRSASAVEDDWFRTARRARKVFEALFYG